ncbi:MAG: PQQ-binding-like beta-propeller repeat protein [Hyphomicrobiaceae bacterium]
MTRRIGVVALTGALLAGCSGGPQLPKLGSLNPFGEKAPPPLEGKRIPVVQKKNGVGSDLATGSVPISLPAAIQNVAWTQPGGTANNAPGHLYLSGAIRRAWSASIGTGSSSYGRLTASPVVADGRVFTLDAAAKVSSFSAAGGKRAWRVDLTPEKESSREGYGGGLAVDSGRLYAATGFGRVSALNPASGKTLWEKKLGIPIRTSPTAAQNKVFILTTSGKFFCLNGDDGEILWEYRGLAQTTQISSNPSPAVDGDVVAVPYPNGDVVAIQISTGTPLWSDSLARSRSASSFASMSDAARPAMSNGVVFAVGHSGRMIATAQATGERLWSASVPGSQTPWVAGKSVFVVDTSGKLMAMSRDAGQVSWVANLPDSRTWSGPTLAGGTLWLASNKGSLVGVDAVTGRVTQKLSAGTPVYIAPVVAGGMLFVLTDKAQLVAFR